MVEAATPAKDSLLDNYSEIRDHYNLATMQRNVGQPLLADNHGFYQQGAGNYLTQQLAGFDKLFYTLVQGIVEDPDFALRKDSRIYERMTRDPQIFYCLAVRKAATAGLNWDIMPPEEYSQDATAKKLAEAVKKRIGRMVQFNEFLDDLLDAVLPGMSVVELVWRLEKGEYTIQRHYPKNKDRFVFDKEGNARLLSPQAPVTGIALPPYKFIVHRFNIKDGSWRAPDQAGYVYYGCGLGDTPLYHYFYFKVQVLRLLMKALDRYSIPQKIFYSGTGQNAALARKMSEILTALTNDSSIVIPGKKGEMTVDQPRVQYNAQVFMGFIEYIDKLITRAILGQELMTEMPQQGSYAAAQVHASVFERIVESDRLLLQDTLTTTLVSYDVSLNAPKIPKQLWPRFVFKYAPRVDVRQFMDSVKSALTLGISVSEAQFREVTGLRTPVEGETLLQAQAQEQGAANEQP